MSIELSKTFLENDTKLSSFPLIGNVDGFRFEHNKLSHRHVQKVGPSQYPGAMNVVNNFLDDNLPVTSVDAICLVQNFDLLNIRNPY